RKRTGDLALELEQKAKAVLTSYRRKERVRRARRLWFRRKLSRQEKRLRSFLRETVVPSTDVVWAAAARPEHSLIFAASILADVRRAAGGQNGKLSYRVFYNLACYDASQNDDDDLALDELQEAFRRSGGGGRLLELHRWAQLDPALRSL